MSIHISKNIKLLLLEESDASNILNLVHASRSELGKYLYWVKEVHDIKSARKYISKRVNSELSGAQWFKIYFKNKVCGVFAIKSVCPDSFVAELGYWLCSSAYGNGIISHIIPKLPEILAESNAKIIEFRCLDQNFASINIAKKSGAKLIDSISNFMVANQVTQNLNIYQALL